MWPFTRKPKRLATTLPINHSLNYLGTEADPVVIYHPTLGQVLMLVPAPAPEFLDNSEVFVEGVKVFDLADAGVIPSYYYKSHSLGYIRT